MDVLIFHLLVFCIKSKIKDRKQGWRSVFLKINRDKRSGREGGERAEKEVRCVRSTSRLHTRSVSVCTAPVS